MIYRIGVSQVTCGKEWGVQIDIGDHSSKRAGRDRNISMLVVMNGAGYGWDQISGALQVRHLLDFWNGVAIRS